MFSSENVSSLLAQTHAQSIPVLSLHILKGWGGKPFLFLDLQILRIILPSLLLHTFKFTLGYNLWPWNPAAWDAILWAHMLHFKLSPTVIKNKWILVLMPSGLLSKTFQKNKRASRLWTHFPSRAQALQSLNFQSRKLQETFIKEKVKNSITHQKNEKY